MKKDYEVLFTPTKIGTCEIKNRFVMLPMGLTAPFEWSAKGERYDGSTHDLLVDRAKDGVGLIIPGCLTVYSMASHQSLADHPEAFEGIPELMDEIHSHGTKVFFQISAGAGRNFPAQKAIYENYEKLNPIMDLDYNNGSADEGLPNRWIPEWKSKQITQQQIRDCVEAIAGAAYLCKQNKVDGIEIHALHEGYLMDQFAMPYTNHRTDEYGGSLENRLRFACEVVQAIKKKCGDDYPVTLRYSVTSRTRDFGKGIIPADDESKEIGRTLEESQKAIKILSDAGYDAFDADNGTYDAWYYAHPPVYMPLNCNLQEVIALKGYTDKPVVCGGRMQLAEAAEAISKNDIQFVGLGRQFLADEHYITKIREEKEEDVRPCISCHLGCMGIGLWKDSGAVIQNPDFTCALNPYTRHEKKYAVTPAETPKKIAIIGGGIAGMEAALQMEKRGHNVSLYEKSNRLGGVFNEAAAFTFKEKDRELIEYYVVQLKKSDVEVHMNSEISDLSELNADQIIVATGASEARKLSIKGSEYTVTALDFLKNGMKCGEQVVIIGGGLTGCEIAYELAMAGKKPVIVEMQDDILKVPGSSMANTSYLRDAFEFYNVPIYTSAKTLEATQNSVIIETENGEKKEISATDIIVSIGYINGSSFDLEAENIHILGDAEKVSNLYHAVLGADDLAIKLSMDPEKYKKMNEELTYKSEGHGKNPLGV